MYGAEKRTVGSLSRANACRRSFGVLDTDFFEVEQLLAHSLGKEYLPTDILPDQINWLLREGDPVFSDEPLIVEGILEIALTANHQRHGLVNIYSYKHHEWSEGNQSALEGIFTCL
jgi:hypothetical protein